MTDRAKPPFASMHFATFVSWRSPQWKLHSSSGPARNAMSYHRGARRELWEFRDGDWHFVEERTGR